MADISFTPFDVIAGPAHVFLAPVGEAMPAIETTPPGGNWVDLGYTDGGVTPQHTQNIIQHRVDQSVFPVKTSRNEAGLTITFNMAQLSLENYKFAVNKLTSDAVSTSGKGKYISLDLPVSVAVLAMLVRAPSPYGTGSSVTDWWLQYELPTVYQSGNPQAAFTRDNKATLALQFSVLNTTGSIGTLRARNSA